MHQLQIEFIRDADINPIVVLSLVDERFPGLRANAMRPPAQLLELKRHAATTFNVPLNMVTYTVNYESEVEREFNIERLCLKNLLMVRGHSFKISWCALPKKALLPCMPMASAEATH
jgi:hypothetical protein